MDQLAQSISTLTITPPRMEVVTFHLIGTTPLMIAKFSAKAQQKIKETQEAGSTTKAKKTRTARNFESDFNAARHISREGWDGLHASSFRNASIDACRAAGFVMTRAKLAIFVEADGYDRESGEPLIKIHGDAPTQSLMAVRNSSGVMDLRARPIWHEWHMFVRMRFDADILTLADVANLMHRVGEQVGVGEGRPYGKQGNGMGMGLFRIEEATT